MSEHIALTQFPQMLCSQSLKPLVLEDTSTHADRIASGCQGVYKAKITCFSTIYAEPKASSHKMAAYAPQDPTLPRPLFARSGRACYSEGIPSPLREVFSTMRVGLIGGGVMAEAMIAGAIRGNVLRPDDVVVGEVVDDRRALLEQRYNVATTADNVEACRNAEMVVLAVKPQSFPSVAKGLAGRLNDRQTVLSIMAGVTLATLTSALRSDAVIRVMPNTPAQEGLGMSAWIAAPPVTATAREGARALLKTLGEEIEFEDEHYLDMATAVSGSGPAYVFTFAEALIDAGVAVGLPRDAATKMVLQTIMGSIALLQRRPQHPAELRAMVTSPGGTTAAALQELERGAFRATIAEAVRAAFERSVALGQKEA